ncbi:D-hexose-6-phosphate mutarotase [Pseudomonas oligotrophica]|uniref:D-hexose-6-phosphate mutarotase n=1 Tax=Pseudomonas oligotrophica TaxID=2912055 RepID=UPI001F193554|nr:D-hexose-6-phosphate mutarotase [Pseudomonas oligotrophica]MCF7200485.1 D-hexose-6-phosphate mutarotase [Pseudomonas oligotrophica]
MLVDIQRIEMGQLACWRLRRGEQELLVAEQGAQLLAYHQGEAQPVIWLSEQATFERGQPVRGGIPVCWPWFGDLMRNPQAIREQHADAGEAPFHGLVRAIDWQLAASHCEADAAVIEFRCAQAASGELPGWPHKVEASLRIRLDEALQVSLTSHNLDDHPVTISQALHSYLAIDDIHQARVAGLEERPYVDTLDDWQNHEQRGELRFTGETDRIYLQLPDTLRLIDGAAQRSIELGSEGSASAILWNPWIDKARRLSQFAEDAWQRMLCIETANVLDDARTLAPGERHTLSVRFLARTSA